MTAPASRNEPSDQCSICTYRDFRKCNHPWGGPFSEWSTYWMSTLMHVIGSQSSPRAGS
jgi:hypothetical protein